MKRWSIALAIGCSGTGPATVQQPRAPSEITCVAVANNMATQVLSHKTAPEQDRLEAIIEIIQRRCEQDRWSIEAKQCLATMKTEEEADQCSTYLTDAQLTAMVHDERARFGKQDEGEPPPPAQAAPPQGGE
jgi:hypothetical protein